MKRSMRGDHSILNDHGAWASVISPTTRMSTPMLRIQSGIAVMTSASGSPDENESKTTDPVRHEASARPSRAKGPEGDGLNPPP